MISQCLLMLAFDKQIKQKIFTSNGIIFYKETKISKLRIFNLQNINYLFFRIPLHYLKIKFIYNYKTQNKIRSKMNSVKNISSFNPEQLENYVLSRVKYENDDQSFKKQLEAQIQKAVKKYEKSIAWNQKIKAMKERAEKDVMRREMMLEQIQNKLLKSQEKREKQFNEKMNYMKKDRKYKHNIYLQRLSKINESEKVNQKNKLKSLNRKMSINKLENQSGYEPKPSQLQQQIHFQKKIQKDHDDYLRKIEMVKNRKSFDQPRLNQKKLSLGEINPRKTDFDRIQSQKIDKVSKKAIQIDERLKKKKKMIEQKIKKSKSIQNYNNTQRQEKMRQLRLEEEEKRKMLAKKLSKTTSVSRLMGYSRSKDERIRQSSIDINSSFQLKNNVSEIQTKKRLNYKNQIRQKIDQYLDEKNKLSKSKVF